MQISKFIFFFLFSFLSLWANDSETIYPETMNPMRITHQYSPTNKTLSLHFEVDTLWHITSNAPKDEFLIPFEIKVRTESGLWLTSPIYPQPTEKFIEALEIEASYFENNFTIIYPNVELSSPLTLAISYYYQACTDIKCLAPEEIIVGIGLPHIEAKAQLEQPEISKAPSKNNEEAPSESLLWMLFLAFLGGLILNLMPCVLPVLSLKFLSLVKQAGESRKNLIFHGSIFSMGVMCSFWILALAITLAKAAGNSVGWGFQFQNPLFVIIMSCIIFLFTLNLFGAFEIILNGGVNTSLAKLGQKQGWLGSFFNGALMTLLSTPCSAPFLGPAMGFAFSQSTVILFLMFSFVALGLSMPYFLLSCFPQAVRFLPKPGKWMNTFKEIMAFLLLATLLWLLWVVGQHGGNQLLASTLIYLSILYFFVWTYNKFLPNSGFGAPLLRKVIVYTLLLFGVASTGTLIIGSALETKETHIKKEAFSLDHVKELQQQGKIVFVDFTADWCLSCKVNEKTVIHSEVVQKLFQEKNVELVIADWTRKDSHISEVLKSFNRVGVPFYVIYPPTGTPITLPEVLTPGIIEEALSSF